jgi:acyl-CoA synthetase (NDP forming)
MRALFRPRSVAVIGASPNGFGRAVMENFAVANYAGDVFGVNPRYDEVLGYRCVSALSELDTPPDAVVVSVARERVVAALEESARAGARAAVVFAFGFAEADDLGAAWQRRVVDVANEAGMAVLGPNCQGLLNFADAVPLYLDHVAPYECGRVGLISQSGSVSTSLINNTRGVRWSHAVSSGNEAVVTAGDLLGYYVSSPAVDVICAFIESIRDADFFFSQCDRAWSTGKPVIVVNTGRTRESQAAAAAHSAALAVPARLLEAALARHNVVCAASPEELLETAIAMQSRRRPRGPGVAVLSGSGGQIALYQDNVARTPLETPRFSDRTRAELTEILPPFLAGENPLDWWGMPDWEQRHSEIVDCVARDPRVDIVLQIGDFTTWPTGRDMRARGALETSRSASASRPDELFVVLEPVGGTAPRELVESALDDDVLVLSGYQTGLRALGHLVDYQLRRAAPQAGGFTPEHPAPAPRVSLGVPVLELLAGAGLDVARSVLLDEGAAAQDTVAAALDFPVVAKIGDGEVLHKTEVDGVILGIATPQELDAAVRRLRTGGTRTVLVQEQVHDGTEIFLGLQSAVDLGTFVLVGVGGIWTELLDDVQIRPVGVTRLEAERMLEGLRAYPLLVGARGRRRVNTELLVEAILRVDALGAALGASVASLDINPLIATPDRAVVVDAALVRADVGEAEIASIVATAPACE